MIAGAAAAVPTADAVSAVVAMQVAVCPVRRCCTATITAATTATTAAATTAAALATLAATVATVAAAALAALPKPRHAVVSRHVHVPRLGQHPVQARADVASGADDGDARAAGGSALSSTASGHSQSLRLEGRDGGGGRARHAEASARVQHFAKMVHFCRSERLLHAAWPGGGGRGEGVVGTRRPAAVVFGETAVRRSRRCRGLRILRMRRVRGRAILRSLIVLGSTAHADGRGTTDAGRRRRACRCCRCCCCYCC